MDIAPDIQERINGYRQKVMSGQPLSIEEMREAVAFLRENRTIATQKAKTKATSKKVINSNDLLGELDAL